MKTKVKVWPYVAIGADGRVGVSLHFCDPKWMYPDDIKSNGRIQEDGAVQVWLSPVELNVEYAPNAVNDAALVVLREQRSKLVAKHQLMMTKLQFLENQLLGLPAPTILDAEPTERPESLDIIDDVAPKGDRDGDIPF